jgi:hypothetical protein
MNAQAVHARTDVDHHVVGIGELRVLICQEDGEWFAQGVEIDYAASGASLADVQRRFEKGLAATVHLHLTRFHSIERLLRFAPAAVWQRLQARAAFAFSIVTVHDLADPDRALTDLPFGQIVYLQENRSHHATPAQG